LYFRGQALAGERLSFATINCLVVLGGGVVEQLHEGRLVADHLPVLWAERQNLVTLLQEQAEDAFPFCRASGVLRVEVGPAWRPALAMAVWALRLNSDATTVTASTPRITDRDSLL
jgi:hypothetical protein